MDSGREALSATMNEETLAVNRGEPTQGFAFLVLFFCLARHAPELHVLPTHDAMAGIAILTGLSDPVAMYCSGFLDSPLLPLQVSPYIDSRWWLPMTLRPPFLCLAMATPMS